MCAADKRKVLKAEAEARDARLRQQQIMNEKVRCRPPRRVAASCEGTASTASRRLLCIQAAAAAAVQREQEQLRRRLDVEKKSVSTTRNIQHA
jgi:hypothetical protein